MQKLRSLEMVRAIAALLVVLFHARIILGTRVGLAPLGQIVSTGYRGVDLFFVLSGFIIAHVHASDIGRSWRLGNYMFNRAARIYPAVWIVTLLAGGLSVAGIGVDDNAIRLGVWDVTASVLLLPQAGDAIVNVTWSLKYELFFYLVFAGLIVNLRAGLALLGIWQFAVLVTSVCYHFDTLGLGGFYLRAICLEFSIGLACAWLTAHRNRVAAMQAATVQWVLLATGTVAFIGGMMIGSHHFATDACCALGAAGITVGLVLLEQSNRIRVPDVLVLLGGASYAIYLVHYSAISLLAVVLIHLHTVPTSGAAFLAAVAFGVAAGAAFDQLVDRPVQRFLREWVKPVLLRVRPQSTILAP